MKNTKVIGSVVIIGAVLLFIFLDTPDSKDEDLGDDTFVEISEQDMKPKKVSEIQESSLKSEVKKVSASEVDSSPDESKDDIEEEFAESDAAKDFLPTKKSYADRSERTLPPRTAKEKTKTSEKSIVVSSIMEEADKEDIEKIAEQMPAVAEKLKETFKQKIISEKEAMDMTPEVEAVSDDIAPLTSEELSMDQ